MTNKILTAEQTRRVHQAMNETYRLLGKELAFSPEFRVQATVDRYIAHLDRLQAMLNEVGA